MKKAAIGGQGSGVIETASVVSIAVDRLQAAPWNARKRFDAASIAELADSIKRYGVQVPLTVRSSGPGIGFEIVCGHRRYAAARNAGLDAVPCIVRELTDDQAREVGLVDNLQREDLPAMEEAEAYGKLLERPGATIETVAAALAKSPSYVGRRAQLLKAIEPVREALRAGAIEVGHALELARLDEGRQRQMLSWLRCGVALVEPNDVEDEDAEPGTCRFCGRNEIDDDTCEWLNDEETICTDPSCLAQFRLETGQGDVQWCKTPRSVVELRGEVERTSFVLLSEAPFPLTADLAPMPCVDCPKRSGNAALLFDDCAQDTCTDKPCYRRKVNAWIEAELEAAKAEKRKLLKLTERWTSDKTVVRCDDWGDCARVFKRDAECGHGEQGIWIDGERAGHAAAVCRDKDCEVHFGKRSSVSGSSRTESTPAEKQKRKELLARVKAEREYRVALFERMAKIDARTLAKTIVAKLATGLTLYAIERSDSTRYGDLAAALGIDKELLGWNGREKLQAHLAALPTESQLLIARLAIEDSELCVHEHDVPGGGALDKRRKLDLEVLAETVGVNWAALRSPAQGSGVSARKSTSADAKTRDGKPAKQKCPGGSNRSKVDDASRKRIAAAMKKRWSEMRKRQKESAKKSAKKGGRK